MTTIDLGEITSDEAAPPMPVNVPRLRRTFLAALAAAGLALTAASAPAGTTEVHPLWSTPLREGESWSLTADTAYVTRFDNRVSAYQLGTGELRWSVSAGSGAVGPRPQPAGGLLLVPADPVMISYTEADGSLYYYETVRTTIALDAATGEQRWRTGGDAHAYGDGFALVSTDDSQGRTVTLRLIRLADGTEVWNRSTAGSVSWTTIEDEGRATAIATVTRDGLVSVYDYATGRPRGSLRLPATGAKQRAGTLISAGGYLAVMRDGSLETETTVYRAGDLRQLWHTTANAGFVTACGDLLCSVGPGGITGRDPGTGTPRWRLPGMRDLWMIGHDRMLVTEDRPAGNGFLVDPATGRTLLGPITGRMALAQNEGDVPLYVRPVSDPPDRLAVIRIDPATGDQRVLGTIPMVTTDDICMTTPGYLACVRDNTLDITAVG